MLEEGDGERDKDKAPNNEVGRDAIHAGEYGHKRLSQVELIFDGSLLPIAQDQCIKPVPCSTCSLHHHCYFLRPLSAAIKHVQMSGTPSFALCCQVCKEAGCFRVNRTHPHASLQPHTAVINNMNFCVHIWDTCPAEQLLWQPTYVLGAHYVRELNALFIAEFHCAIVSDGHTLDLEHHVVDLQGFCCRRQGVNLEHQAA